MSNVSAQRWFPPSFDPPPREPEPEIVWPTVEEIESIREAARREGFGQGREEGFRKGFAEGVTQGFEQGLQEGRERSFDEHKEQVKDLTETLSVFINELRDLPEQILEPITDLAWAIGQRLTLADQIDRVPFLNAVQEALMRLPLPGENLLLRVPLGQHKLWQEFLDRAALPFGVNLISDEDQTSGAYIEIDGMKMDLGADARKAIVLMAMGLLPTNGLDDAIEDK
jgi:flagellar biosynthesis/type III secretory pathway protein FliH